MYQYRESDRFYRRKERYRDGKEKERENTGGIEQLWFATHATKLAIIQLIALLAQEPSYLK